MAVRAAIGASRWRLIRQVLVESLLLSAAGGLAGLGLAILGVRSFDMAVQNVGKPSWVLFTLDYAVLAYFTVVCVAAGLIFGLAPALRASRVDLQDTLKDGGRSGSGHGGRLSSVLVVFQLALAIVVLAGAGLLVRSYALSQQVNDWIPRDAIMTARVVLPDGRYPDRDTRVRFFDDVRDRLAAVPGATAVSLVSNGPGLGAFGRRFELEGALVPVPSERQSVPATTVSPGYFDAIGLEVVRGRDFGERDGLDGRESAIVTGEFASRFWPGEDALGKRLRFNPEDDPGPWMTVVGVTDGFVQRSGESQPEVVIFVPYRQEDPTALMMMVRTTGDGARLGPALRTGVQTVDPELPLYEVETLASLVYRAHWPYRVFGSAFAIFGLAALLMAGVGLYAVMAQATVRRTREIGIRMALGATPARILRTVMTRGIVQMATGLVLGLGLALMVTGAMQALLFGIAPNDPVVFASVGTLLVTVGLVATWLPAWRAARVAPVQALNDDEPRG